MSVETVARRYASALADVAIKSGDPEGIKAELGDWNTMIFSNSDLSAAFANPSIAHAHKEKVLEQLISKTAPSTTTANFLRVLLRNSRLIELPAINDKLAVVLEERSGIVSGSVISARELSEDEKQGFANQLNSTTGKNVKLSFKVDEDLLGGAVTRVGSTVFDGSVRTQLDNLREKMIKS